MGETSQGFKGCDHDRMAGLARDAGEKAGAAGVMFPTTVVKWVSDIMLVLHAFLPKRDSQPMLEAPALEPESFRPSNSESRSHYLCCVDPEKGSFHLIQGAKRRPLEHLWNIERAA